MAYPKKVLVVFDHSLAIYSAGWVILPKLAGYFFTALKLMKRPGHVECTRGYDLIALLRSAIIHGKLPIVALVVSALTPVLQTRLSVPLSPVAGSPLHYIHFSSHIRMPYL